MPTGRFEMLLLQALMSNPITDLLLGGVAIFLFTAIVTCRAASRGDLGSDQHLQTRVHILFFYFSTDF